MSLSGLGYCKAWSLDEFEAVTFQPASRVIDLIVAKQPGKQGKQTASGSWSDARVDHGPSARLNHVPYDT